ncbi:MAG: sulfatase-like hydrolase/transferase, partial [Candidatus Krumholzibacteria bacterium]|nr:sulfatase-like hydrolase/transferase [Candidatus Krumholzibacteria bacterium]
MKRLTRILPVVTAALVASLGGGCAREDRPLNLVLITVDTLRPDRLGYNGHSRPTSPVIDRLASEGVVFANAYSAAGWTLPSVAT